MNESIENAIRALRLAEPKNIEDVEAIITEVRDVQRRYEFARQRAFSVGDRVKFEGRGGRTVTGRVTKILQKNVKVQEEGGPEWRVSPSLLTHAGEGR